MVVEIFLVLLDAEKATGRLGRFDHSVSVPEQNRADPESLDGFPEERILLPTILPVPSCSAHHSDLEQTEIQSTRLMYLVVELHHFLAIRLRSGRRMETVNVAPMVTANTVIHPP